MGQEVTKSQYKIGDIKSSFNTQNNRWWKGNSTHYIANEYLTTFLQSYRNYFKSEVIDGNCPVFFDYLTQTVFTSDRQLWDPEENEIISFTTTNTLPSGLYEVVGYRIINVVDGVFELYNTSFSDDGSFGEIYPSRIFNTNLQPYEWLKRY